MKIIQISSSIPGEGKTTTAANLAVVLAQAGNRVVLVDADLRKPQIHEVFGIDGTRGLTDALLGEPVESLLMEVPVDGGIVTVLPAGRVPTNPSEMMSGKRIKALLQHLAESTDVVVVDSAPLLPVTDSVALSGSVDGLVLVAQAGRTPRKRIVESVAILSQVSAPLLGVVMNRVAGRKLRSYGYGYGYDSKYGYGYGHSSRAATPATTSATTPETTSATIPATPVPSP